MSEWQRQIDTNPWFCILPFNHLHVSTNGTANLCCVADHQRPVLTDTSGQSLDSLWHGAEYQRVRDSMLQRRPEPRCQRCYSIDASGGGSDRQVHNANFRSQSDDWDLDIARGNSRGTPDWMDLRPGRFCNLACRMCFVGVSSAVADEHRQTPSLESVTGESWHDIRDWLDDPITIRSVQDLIPSLRCLKLAGGEPLYMPQVLRLLRWCRDTGNTHLELDITTNGTAAKGKVLDLLGSFRRVYLHVSMDGVGMTNDYIRHGSSWPEVDAAYQRYSAMANVQTSLLATVQAYNAHQLPEIVRYWRALGSQGSLIFNFVENPSELSVDILPHADRCAIADQLHAAAEGLTAYQLHRMRFHAVVTRLRQPDAVGMDRLRQQWARRTRAYDQLRGQDIAAVSARLSQLVQLWHGPSMEP